MPVTHIKCCACNTVTGAHPIIPVPVHIETSKDEGPEITYNTLVAVTDGKPPKVSTTSNSWEVAEEHAQTGATSTDPTIIFANVQRTMVTDEEHSEVVMNPNSVRAYVDESEVKISKSKVAGQKLLVTIPSLDEITAVKVTLSGPNLEELKKGNQGYCFTDRGMFTTFSKVVDDNTVQLDVISPKTNAAKQIFSKEEVVKYHHCLRAADAESGAPPKPDWFHFTPNGTTAAPGKASLYFAKDLAELSEWTKQWEQTWAAETAEEMAEREKKEKTAKTLAVKELTRRGKVIDAMRRVSPKEKVALKKEEAREMAAAAKEESDKANAEVALCKDFRIGQVEAMEFPAIVVEQSVLLYKPPFGAEASHGGSSRGGGGGGGGAAAASRSSKELTRGLPLPYLSANLVKHMDFRRSCETNTDTCAQVHGGDADTICGIPAKVKKLVSIVSNADPADTFLVCAGYPETTKAAAAALAGIERLGRDAVETVLADDDQPGHGGAGTRARKFQEFQSQHGKKVLCMEFKGNSDGINLFAANNLILLDTPKSWEIEKQLVGRVYRIGQQRDVTVHTIVVENTIESRQANQRQELRRSAGSSTLDDVESGDSATATCKMLKWLITGKKGY